MSDALLVACIFAAALLFSTVGHAGASGYLAAMGLLGVAAQVMKPAALVLNILVAAIATVRFYRAGCFSWKTLWPFVVGSVPLAFVGGAIQLPEHVYKPIVGAVLLFAAWRLAATAQRPPMGPKRPTVPAAVAVGGVIGLLSGLTGTGGGILFSPLLLLARWADIREVAGASAAFVLVNSISGLAGNVASVQYLPPIVGIWAVAAGTGGIIGSELGSRRVAPAALRYVLAAVTVASALKMIAAAWSTG